MSEELAPGRGEILLTAPENARSDSRRAYGEIFGIKYSPLSRKIVTFNLVALCLMMSGILYLNQFDDSLISVQERALETDAQFISESLSLSVNPLVQDDQLRPETVKLFRRFTENSETYAQLFDVEGMLVAFSHSTIEEFDQSAEDEEPTRLGLIEQVSSRFARLFSVANSEQTTAYQMARFTSPSLRSALAGNLRRSRASDDLGRTILTVALPLIQNDVVNGAVVVSTAPGEIDAIVSRERGQILRIFFLAMVINVILSLALANTIAHPLQELAEAAERGSATDSRTVNPERIEIPDLTGRPDEIGYLAGAMSSMTTALYDRIEANETFAADVAHEIKNPLTSLRSAVDTMKYAKDDAGREKLLGIIQMDVTRLDRLVTDISNASRLDGELVRDERLEFDIKELIDNLVEYNQDGAKKRGAKLVADLPDGPLRILGMEGRIAQVLVNLITNAISFTEEGGQVTVIARMLDNGDVRVLVEDTGPGIPNDNLADVFKRFYSERPGQDFGNNSGLGLAISKQIVDAHGGRIYAENIRAPGVGLDTPPDGARFTLELPVA